LKILRDKETEQKIDLLIGLELEDKLTAALMKIMISYQILHF